MLRRNIGTPWRRPGTGVEVPHGAVFDTTVREEQHIADTQAALRFPLVVDGVEGEEDAALPQVPSPPSVQIPPPPPPIDEDWPLRMSPREYLERYPGGKQAALARSFVARGKGG